MSILDIKDLSHSFGEEVIFKNTEMTLNKGEHIGIVGQNGAGKSTLINICTGQILPDKGSVIWHPKVTAGYLDQYASIEDDISINKFLKSAFQKLYAVEEKMNHIYEKTGQGEVGQLELAARCQEQLEREDFYQINTKIKQIASGLGLDGLGLERQLSTLSGGQRAKVILAKLLLSAPDVLLLDEPTNFLDKEHITWLSGFLSSFPGAMLVISHDFNFLEKISTGICDIEHGSIRKYYGTYSEFLKKKKFLREDYIRKYTAQQREIKKTEEFIRQNIAGRKTRMAKGRRKQLERMERIEALDLRAIKPSFCFQGEAIPQTEQLIVKRLSIGYYYPLLSDLSFSVKGGQKIAITGFNGIGKSTLLKTLLGQIPQLSGSFTCTEYVSYGYYEQDFVWKDQGLTPIQAVSDAYPNLPDQKIRQHLSKCGIPGKLSLQPIGTLSGGEQAKLKLSILVLQAVNFLIMDEPTNHLDIQAKEALKEALKQFHGSVLLVSHEEAFYRDWIDRVVPIEDLHD